MNLLTNFTQGEWNDQPMKRAREDPFQEIVNPLYNDHVTQTRNLVAHPDENQRAFLSDCKDMEIMFIDPTQADIVNSKEVYGYQYYHVEKTAPIDLIRIDEIPDAAVNNIANQNNAVKTQMARDYADSLNRAAEIHEMRFYPVKGKQKYVDIQTPINRFFAENYDFWKKKVMHRFRIGGLIKYKGEAISGPGRMIYELAMHEASLTTVVQGLVEVNNVWKGPVLGINPRNHSFIGYQASTRYRASDSNPGVIEVIPKIVPAVCEDAEKRTELLDYLVGRVAHNAQTDAESSGRSNWSTYLTVQMDAV